MTAFERSRRTLAGWLPVVEYCAEEVRRQRAGPLAVGWMIEAWWWAMTENGPINRGLIEKIGSIVEPGRNSAGFRRVGVRVGWDTKPDPDLVPRMIDNLCAGPLQHDDPAEFYHQFEEIHPFVDGNGRTGKILYNYLLGTLDAPVWPPSFWGDIENP